MPSPTDIPLYSCPSLPSPCFFSSGLPQTVSLLDWVFGLCASNNNNGLWILLQQPGEDRKYTDGAYLGDVGQSNEVGDKTDHSDEDLFPRSEQMWKLIHHSCDEAFHSAKLQEERNHQQVPSMHCYSFLPTYTPWKMFVSPSIFTVFPI